MRLIIINSIINQMSWHMLELNYQEFVKNNKSIADTVIDNYIVYGKLGSGAFGSVYRGMNDKTKKQVAIKVLDLVAIEREESNNKVKQIRRRLAKTESELMMKVDSDYVMKLYDVYENKWLKIMVIQYCNGGPLSEEILRRKKIPEKEAIEIIKQIIMGLSAMHKENIIHRDLKTDNIMSHNGIYKIIDLGFAKMIPPDSDIWGTVLGTIITMAPEVMRRQKYGLKADIWSIGVIFYEMLYGKLPYEPMKSADMYQQIVSKDIFPNGGKVNGIKPSNQALQVLKKMLIVDHHKRLGWEELISQDIFKAKGNLPDEYRVTVNLDILNAPKKLKERDEDQIIQKIQNMKFQTPELKKTVRVERLTEKEKKKKEEQLDKTEINIVQWAVANHLECLKTQLIFKQIMLPIEERKMLDLSNRKVIQFMYLLSSRCYINMSFVLNDFVDSYNPIVVNLKNTVEVLYKQVGKKFEKYSKILTDQENKVSSIIGDRFEKIFNGSEMKTKDRFLTGLQNIQFKKEQQIWFTYDHYIKQLIDHLKPKDISIRSRLKNYKQINDITMKDLKNKKFYDRVEQIIMKDEKE